MDRPDPKTANTPGVVRLKELLFDHERQALADLQRRIELLSVADREIVHDVSQQLEALAASARADRETIALQLERLSAGERAERAQINAQIAQLQVLAGTRDSFRATVASVIDGAIRDAEIERHDAVSDAMAPMVVHTVRTEIRNSRDEIVDALYPMTGRMVKAYVASAMKDLADSINRRLESNTFVLRLRSMTSGRSMAELAMADTQWPRLDELFLVRRGTGELVARWPESDGGANHDVVFGGILAAINDFAREAFAEEGGSLRRIDVGSSLIYLRGSPAYLLAAKLTGTAPPAVEEIIDQAYLSVLEHHRNVFDAAVDTDAGDRRAVLKTLAGQLDEDISQSKVEHQLPPLGFKPLLIGLALVLLPLATWIGYGLWSEHRNTATLFSARQAIASLPALKGYGLRLDVTQHGRALSVTGLVPTESVRTETLRLLSSALPQVTVRSALTPIPAGGIDPRPAIEAVRRDVSDTETALSQRLSAVRAAADSQVRAVAGDVTGVRGELQSVERTLKSDLAAVRADIERTSAIRSLARAERRLREAGVDLTRLAEETTDLGRREIVDRALGASMRGGGVTRAALGSLQAANPGANAAEARNLAALGRTIDGQADGLAMLLGADVAGSGRARPADGAPASLLDAADAVSASAERLAVTVLAVLQSNAVRRSIPKPQPVATPGPLDQLRAFVLTHAIFFSNRAEPRDADATRRTLDTLAGLVTQAGAALRVVGYTDETGGADRNTSVSQERADAIVAALVARGVPRTRLIAIGRQNMIDVSPVKGPDSPNRRVEFEIAFDGEVAR